MRVKDRHQRDFVIQPTSEEVITDIARQELRSYRQLPRNFYHIQTKFRDERRPRFGIMRGREFTMKDAYSFDRDKESALRSYQGMFEAYKRIFDRFGLQYRAVAADTGAIGGDASHEFQVIADTGEDAIAYCPGSDYAANVELAEALPLLAARPAPAQAMVRTPTPGKATCEDVAELLGLPLAGTVKSLVLASDDKDESGAVTKTTLWLLLVRGDHGLNEVKAGKLPGLKDGFRFATAAEIAEHFGCKPGYLGPVATRKPVQVIADRTVANMADFVCGANEADFHLTGVNWGRDLPEPDLVADIRNVVAGDPSPDGRGELAIQRGIEVGHVFYLGTKKYSEPMGAHFLDGAFLGRRLPDRLRAQRPGARGRRRPARTAADGRDRRRAGRPRRAPGGHVRRLGADRRAAARGHLRARPQGRHRGGAGPSRRGGDRGGVGPGAGADPGAAGGVTGA
jgi:prolyl-tRNA synthetase